MLETARGDATAQPPADQADDNEPQSTRFVVPTRIIVPTELRPARFLVPTKRRTDYFMSPELTLFASDLGIRRTTTDAQLTRIAKRLSTDLEQLPKLTQMRDSLRHPRDIEDARAWGLEIPVNEFENSQEFDENPNERLGWWWVYDLKNPETRIQRRERYLGDTRLMDTKGMARIYSRSRVTVRDHKVATDRARDYIANIPGARQEQIAKFLRENPGYPSAGLEQKLLDRARRRAAKGTPRAFDKAGQSDLFRVGDVINAARIGKRLNEWYEHADPKQEGRPVGSRTIRRRSPKA